MDKMFVIAFDSEEKAYQGARALTELHAEGSIALYAAAVVARDAEGKVTVKQAADEGPLGTVTGMIRSFNQIAITEGAARPSQLAGGISEALVTTCMGLVVAIPTMFFVSFFRNRIDSCVAEAETVVEKLMGRFRKTAE